MNIIKSFNNTIDYLETVLDDEIDEKKVTQLSGYSYSMFSRLFSILTETTLSEYLRSRRLTEAAVILRNTDEKIIDVAFKFGYESSDSFGTAFKNFHGFTPSEARNGKPFKLVSRVQLALSVRGGRSMNITIQKKQAFTVAGVNEQSINHHYVRVYGISYIKNIATMNLQVWEAIKVWAFAMMWKIQHNKLYGWLYR